MKKRVLPLFFVLVAVMVLAASAALTASAAKLAPTLSYQTNGGSAVESTRSGQIVFPAENPTKDGCIFEGWYTDVTLETQAVAGTPIAKDTTLYANWLEVICKIGSEEFASVSSAIESVTDNTATTIFLVADAKDNIRIPKNRNITLDLNGYALTSENNTVSVIYNLGRLTIKDSNATSQTHYFTFVKDGAWVYLPNYTAVGGEVKFENIAEANLTSGTTVISVSGGVITRVGECDQFAGIYNDDGAKLTIENVNIVGNKTQHSAIYNVHAELVVNKAHILGNTSYSGAGIKNYNGTATIGTEAGSNGDVVISYNTTTANGNLGDGGGAIYNVLATRESAAGEETSAALTIHHATITNNKSAYKGGGISNAADKAGTASVVMNDGIVSHNESVHNGGGIANYTHNANGRAIVTVKKGLISENKALTRTYGQTTASGGNGGGIANNGMLVISGQDVIISANEAAIGGGVYNDGTFSLEKGKIDSNKAKAVNPAPYCAYEGLVGGVYNDTNGSLLMSGGSITNNNAESKVGGVLNQGAFAMTGGFVTGNTANTANGVGGVAQLGTMAVGGTAVIKNNKENTSVNSNLMTASPIYIGEMTVAGVGTIPALSSGAEIGMTFASAFNAANYSFTKSEGKFVGSAGADTYAKYFVSDSDAYEILSAKNSGSTTYAYRVAKKYTITYTVNGGSAVANAASAKIVFPAENPTKDGCVFEGWYTDVTLETQAVAGTPIAKDTTLYANWIEVITTQPNKDGTNDYTVVTDAALSGLTYQWYRYVDGENDVALTGETNAKLGAAAPAEACYYCVVSQGETPVAQSQKITPKKITFAGGKGVTGSAPEAVYQFEGRSVTLPANPFTADGGTFAGWSDGENKYLAGSVFTVTGDTAFTAVLEHTCHNLIFDKVLCEETLQYSEWYECYELFGGNFYLTEDLTLTANILQRGDAAICLNGHVLNLNGHSIDGWGCTLILADCQTKGAQTHYYKVDGESGLWKLADASEYDKAVAGGAVTGGGTQYLSAVSASYLIAEDVNFIGNGTLDTEKGGAAHVVTASLRRCRFLGNAAEKGGAVYADDELALYASEFAYNRAAVDGGAVYAVGKARVDGCTLKNNDAGQKGGALLFACLNSGDGAFTVLNTVISDNQAGTQGGGIAFDKDGCFAEGTKITMADGSEKNIEDIKVGDLVKTFNHETGTLESGKVSYVYAGSTPEDYFTLCFAGGKTLNIYDCHDLFDRTANKYVTVSSENCADFIGHEFYNAAEGVWETLESVTLCAGEANYYSIYVFGTQNCLADGMLSVPDDVDFILNVYHFDADTLKVNQESLAADIAQYGLFTYEECSLCDSREMFNDANLQYKNLYIGKGLITAFDLNQLYYSAHGVDEFTRGIRGFALILGKNAVVKDNKAGEKVSNVALDKGAVIYVVDGASGIKAGVSLADTVGDFAENVYTKDASKIAFTSDCAGLTVRKTASKTLPVTYTYSLAYIKEQPTKDNDYTVVVEQALTGVTYQWYRYNEFRKADLSPASNGFASGDYDENSLAGEYELNVSFALKYFKAGGVLKYKGTGDFYDECGDDGYYTHPFNACNVIDDTYFYVLVEGDGQLEVTDFIIVWDIPMAGETGAKLGTTQLTNAAYYCKLTRGGEVIAESDRVTPVAVSFAGGVNAVGTAPATVYQPEGRTIILPANPFTRTGYKFDKWGTTAAGASYTVGASNVTLTAVWTEKTAVSIAETPRSVTYNGEAQPFALEGTHKDIGCFTVLYYVGSAWTAEAPENAGEYDVKIARAEDTTYASYEKTIPAGLVIGKYVVPKEDITLAEDDFTYNGKNQAGSLTASYKDAKGNRVALSLAVCGLSRANVKETPTFTEAGGYTAVFLFKTSLEENNYALICQDGGSYYEGYYTMKPKAVTIDWTADNFTYDGNVQTVTASYKDVEGKIIPLSLSPENFKDAGTYTVTANFAGGETNYVLPAVSAKTYTVAKAASCVATLPTANASLTYNGSAQALVTGGTAENGTMLYKLAGGTYGTAIPTAADAGTYVVYYKAAGDNNHNDTAEAAVTVTIGKLAVKQPVVTGSYTYTGAEQTAAVAGKQAYMTESGEGKAIDAGTYTLTYTLDGNHTWAEGSDGTVTWSIAKAQAVIAVDTAPIVKTYGDIWTLPAAASNFGTVVCDKRVEDLANAGCYTLTYWVAATDNYEGDTKIVTVTVNSLAVDEPGVEGTYKYDGTRQKAVLSGVQDCMTTQDSLFQIRPGVYTITFTLDDNHRWAEGSDGVVTWEIKATKITPDEGTSAEGEKQSVVFETQEGFPSDVILVVEVTAETSVAEQIEKNETIVDYYRIQDESVKLAKDEQIGVIFHVKLIQMINGEGHEIQPSDIAPGTKIRVKMLIPEEVDTSKVTRILHVHGAEDIEEIPFDASCVDEDGYYEIEIDRLSEFAFVYERDFIHLMALALLAAFGGFTALLWFAFAIRTFRGKEQNKLHLAPVIGFALHLAATVVLAFLARCPLCLAAVGANLAALAAATLLYLGVFGKKTPKTEER